jgi:pimeloyl-ACP methyl ester carboxylesterase
MGAGGTSSLFWRSSGVGTPTVVFDAGLGETSDTWAKVEARVAQQTRTLVYDRANMGRSGHAPHPRTSAGMVAELRDLLISNLIDPPYVLVGHSFGGLNMMLFARLHPDEVAGLVLVDSSHPDQTERFLSVLSPEQKARYIQGFVTDEGITFEERVECEHEVSAAPAMPDVPLYVLMSGKKREGKGDWPYAEWDRLWREQQEDLARLTSSGKFLVAEQSGHYIHTERPELVITSIQEVLAAVRNNAQWAASNYAK